MLFFIYLLRSQTHNIDGAHKYGGVSSLVTLTQRDFRCFFPPVEWFRLVDLLTVFLMRSTERDIERSEQKAYRTQLMRVEVALYCFVCSFTATPTHTKHFHQWELRYKRIHKIVDGMERCIALKCT